MFPELEKPRVTEIQVRMDCNGCVQKIKKALHGINGIYDLYIDFPHQKLTIIGRADPEKIVKAIRKTRKIATICSHTEQQQPEPSNQPMEQTPEGGGAAPPPTDGENPPPEDQPAEVFQPGEPPKDQPPPENPPPQPENPAPPEVKPSPIAAYTNENQQAGPSGSKEIGEVHVIPHHPPDYGYRYGYPPQSYPGHWNRYPSGQVIQQHEAAPQQTPIHAIHSYNTYKPSPHVTEYEYVRSPPPPPRYTHYSRIMDHYSEDYHQNSNNVYHSNSYGNENGNITSMFSDENPNACRIM